VFTLGNRRAVITGAASGLGRALALNLARQGWLVGVVDRDVKAAEETLEMIEEGGGRGIVYPADVSKAEDVEELAAFFFREWGGVDLLINNAGVLVVGLAGEVPLENWQWQLENNFWSVIYGCYSFIPRMKKQGGGYIINIASSAGTASLPEMSPYNVTKAAVISFSETLRAELAPDNIGVTVVCPTYFNTSLWHTMRYTQKFQRDFNEAAFTCARISAEKVARLTLQAAAKKKVYCFPQLSAKFFWLLKRLAPQFVYKTLALLYRRGWGRPLLLWMARRGLT